MMFAGGVGVDLDPGSMLSGAASPAVMGWLFNEELGAVLQVRAGDVDQVVALFDAHGLGKGRHHFDGLEAHQLRRMALGQFGKPHQRCEIACKSSADPRAEHFHGHFAPFAVDGEMHLGNRRRSDRRFVETGVTGLQRCTEVGFDHRFGSGERKGRQAVLQAGQIGRGLLAQDIGARRQRLAELDEGGAQGGEGERQALTGA